MNGGERAPLGGILSQQAQFDDGDPVFTNRGYDATITLAHVFWMADGNATQPERLFLTADRALSVTDDFSDFGTDVRSLKKRLTGSGVRVHPSFTAYSKDFRRRMGIESEQALELFHQTVSMKSVGSLDDFVRSHMLEPFDAALMTETIVAHFDALTTTYESVQRARAQIDTLTLLLPVCGPSPRSACAGSTPSKLDMS